jgi:hypothetical protein
MNGITRIALAGMLGVVLAGAVGCPPRRVAPLRPIYNQGAYGDSGGLSEVEYSTLVGVEQHLGDDFMLGLQGSTITYIQWWGAYRDNVPADDDFTILIYARASGGYPEAFALAEYNPATVNRTATGNLFGPGGWALDIYEYSMDVTPLALERDTIYFIVILNDTGTWYWSSNGSDSEGNRWGVEREGWSDGWLSHGIDMAFRLWSDE